MRTGTEQLPDRRVLLPARSASVDEAAQTRSAPVFGEGKAWAEVTEKGTELHFPRASGAHSYLIVSSDGEEQSYFSDFYLGDLAEGESQSLLLYGMKEGVKDIEVRAVSSYGEKSEGSVRINGVRVLARSYRRKLAPEIWY